MKDIKGYKLTKGIQFIIEWYSDTIGPWIIVFKQYNFAGQTAQQKHPFRKNVQKILSKQMKKLKKKKKSQYNVNGYMHHIQHNIQL